MANFWPAEGGTQGFTPSALVLANYFRITQSLTPSATCVEAEFSKKADRVCPRSAGKLQRLLKVKIYEAFPSELEEYAPCGVNRGGVQISGTGGFQGGEFQTQHDLVGITGEVIVASQVDG